jgi:two-component system nitrogen regulation response regulator GlnG
LRERVEDLMPLVQHYLRRFSRVLGREVREVDPEALERLRRHSWPGNIRELQSVLKQALLKSTGGALLPAFLPALAGEPVRPEPESPSTAEDPKLEMSIRLHHGSDQGDLYAEVHRQVDRVLLARVLEETGGNQNQAARRLGIARETLRRRLRELGLQITRQLGGEDDPHS